MLFAALAPLPIGYYTLLRMAVTLTSVLMAFNHYANNKIEWTITFGILALIFNPLIPIYLGEKNIWIPIDLLAGFLFVYQGIIMRGADYFKTPK